MKKSIITYIFLILGFSACVDVESHFELPVLGRQQIVEKMVDGKMVKDTLPHTIADFSFVNQDSAVVTNEDLKDKIYVADFFFTTCPTICPIMKKEMLRVYEAYKGNEEVAILSHTIDPEHDTVALLKQFAQNLSVDTKQWQFLTGDKDEIYDIGEESYMVVANEDPDQPGGFIHSGAFILVDKKRRIRGIYDGTQKNSVDILIKDIKRLLKAYEKKQSS
ncbi:MAG TPA: SCO family protein [Cyclobacteriaceae bacterium]